MIPCIVVLLSWVPDIVQMHFCTAEGAMDPTFQMNDVPAFLVAREVQQKLRLIFVDSALKNLITSFVSLAQLLSPSVVLLTILVWS